MLDLRTPAGRCRACGLECDRHDPDCVLIELDIALSAIDLGDCEIAALETVREAFREVIP